MTAKAIVKAALLGGELIFDGGCYPSRTVISYNGSSTVTLEGRIFLVEGIPSGGRWYDRMWLDGKDGGVKSLKVKAYCILIEIYLVTLMIKEVSDAQQRSD